jgi:1-acyl-sn-glycerol-3-phosphate acyltransferase
MTSFRERIIRANQKLLYYCFMQWLCRIFSVEVVRASGNASHKKMDRPLVIVSNHCSNWDAFLIFSAVGENFFIKHIPWRLPAYADFFKKIYFLPHRIFLRSMGCFPIRSMGNLEKSMASMLEALRCGGNTVFFPEGKRVRIGEELKIKRGIGHLVKALPVYIQPVHIEYSRYGINGKGSIFGKIRIIIGEIYKSEYFLEKYEKNHHEGVMEHVRGLKAR